MVISPYPKPTKCYGDTVIRRAEKVDSITEKVDSVLEKIDKRELSDVLKNVLKNVQKEA